MHSLSRALSLLKCLLTLHQVENIALLANAPEHGFVGVNMYVDDAGSIKQLPLNMRASDIAVCAGKPMEVRYPLICSGFHRSFARPS